MKSSSMICKECGAPVLMEYSVVGLCHKCIDVVQNLDGEVDVDNDTFLQYYEDTFTEGSY